MDLRRLRAGELVAALSGVALLVSLFLPWFGFAAAGGGEDTLTAWQTLSALDVLLALVAAAGVSLVVITAFQRVPAVPIAADALVAWAGIVGLILIAIRLVSDPAPPAGGSLDATPEPGLWLGLVAALGIVAGGFLAMRDERLSPEGKSTDHTGSPAPPPPELEPLPAPDPKGSA